MKQRRTLITLVSVIIMMAGFTASAIAEPGRMGGGKGPYGGYCQGPRWGWYGARTPVTTVDDARKHLEKFFEGQPVTIGPITEQDMFFKADIHDREGRLADQVIIHKRSGRIRSTF
jgi:hypothetical protein